MGNPVNPSDISAIRPSDISSLWAILVSLVVALFSLGVFKAKVATKLDLEKMGQDFLKRLYREDGATIFLPRDECEKSQSSCGNRICARLDEMRLDTQRKHEEDLASRRDHLLLHADLAEFVGSVRQFMQYHKRKDDP